jgi:general secretion pathway protein A
VPRLINLLCDRALLAAYARGRTQVGLWLVRAAAREIETGKQPARRRAAVLALGALLVAGAAGAGLWRFAPQWLAPLTASAERAPATDNSAPPAAVAPEPAPAAVAAVATPAAPPTPPPAPEPTLAHSE